MAESAAPTSLTGVEPLVAALAPESSSFTSPLDLSVVVPLYNEEGSLPHLIEQVLAALRPLPLRFEVVLVDDGSRDGTPALLRDLAGRVPELVAVLLRRNYGQTAAMAAGFDASRGAVIVTLDGDLQNDPADIPLLLQRLQDGNFDLVSGWRHQRQDAAVSRLLPSLLANKLIGRVTGVKLHDYGCSLKAYRRELVSDMNLYGELHRFVPVLAHWKRFRVGEIVVEHCPTEQMWTDINTKPKQGAVFREFRAQVMGIEPDYNDATYASRIYLRPPDHPVGFHAPEPTDKPIGSPGRTMLPVPKADSIASQECVGGYPIGEVTAGETDVAEKPAQASHSERNGEERAPLLWVRGGRWSPGVYHSLRLLGRPRKVAWERAFISLPIF